MTYLNSGLARNVRMILLTLQLASATTILAALSARDGKSRVRTFNN
jgi:hypothetical protein